MSELKLCPFCDGESVSIRMVRLNRRSGYRASCNGCGITQGGIVHPSIEAAKEAWNRRAKPEQPANKESLTTAEPVASPAGYFCEPYLNKPGLFEQVFNGFDDPDVIPLYRDPNGRIAALEREVEALRNPNNDLNQLRELISDSFDAGYSAYSDFDSSKCRTVKQEQYVEEVMERLVDKALAGGEAG